MVGESLAQCPLGEFADARLRDLVDEHDIVGDLPAGQMLAQERQHLVAAQLFPRAHHDACKRTLHPLRMRNSDHRRLGDLRVSHDQVLDFDRADPLTARLDQILRPIDQSQVAER